MALNVKVAFVIVLLSFVITCAADGSGFYDRIKNTTRAVTGEVSNWWSYGRQLLLGNEKETKDGNKGILSNIYAKVKKVVVDAEEKIAKHGLCKGFVKKKEYVTHLYEKWFGRAAKRIEPVHGNVEKTIEDINKYKEDTKTIADKFKKLTGVPQIIDANEIEDYIIDPGLQKIRPKSWDIEGKIKNAKHDNAEDLVNFVYKPNVNLDNISDTEKIIMENMFQSIMEDLRKSRGPIKNSFGTSTKEP